MRMYAVHSEYEVVVGLLEESSAQHYRCEGGVGDLTQEILKKILVYVASGAI